MSSDEKKVPKTDEDKIENESPKSNKNEEDIGSSLF